MKVKSVLIVMIVVLLLFTSAEKVAIAQPQFPEGKGMWIWRLWEVEGADLNLITQRLNSANVEWVVIKLGDSDSFWTPADLTPEKINQFHNAGIKVYGWHYVYGYDRWDISGVSEADVSIQILNIPGIDGLIINAECEYEQSPGGCPEWRETPQTKAELAEQYMQAIRAAHPNSFIAYSTFARIDSHLWFPYLEFGRYSDAVMPQTYWGARPTTPENEMAILKEQWNRWHETWIGDGFSASVKPIIPTGQGYEVPVEEIVRFMNISSNDAYQAVSLYRYGTMTEEMWNAYASTSLGRVELTPLGCDQEHELRSVEGTTPTSIEFINASTQSRQIHWLNYEGQRVLWFTLESDQSYVQDTYLTQPWLVSDLSGTCLGIYQPTESPGKVTLMPGPPAGRLEVIPADGLACSGPEGGPFSDCSKTYTLSNPGGSPIDYTVSRNQNWVDPFSSAGFLASGASIDLTVSINSNANNLSPGSYSDTVTFTNVTNGEGSTTRSVNLTVTPIDRPVVVKPATPPTALGGAELDVLVLVDEVTNLGGAQFTLVYDVSVLSLIGEPQLANHLDSEDCTVGTNTDVTGKVSMVIACIAGGYSGAPLPLASLRFQAAQVTETTTTALTVQDQGLVLSNSDLPIPGRIPAQGGSADITIVPGVCGDLTGDDVVDVLDPITGLRGIVNLIALTPLQLILGNVVVDQFFNVQDVILIMRHIVGQVPELEGCGPL